MILTTVMNMPHVLILVGATAVSVTAVTLGMDTTALVCKAAQV